jgi:hypothetical protein
MNNKKEPINMSDEQTMKDHIEDLMIEQTELHKQARQLQRQIDHLRMIADSAFNLAGGCITGCKRACMCNCGYEHWNALQHKKN